MNKHTRYDLTQMQSLPLESKIKMSKQRIRQWYEHWDGDVYVSFSGGKDSTVLLHLVRSIYPDVEAVFSDTGLEFPAVRKHVKTFDNVRWMKPEMTFRDVIFKKGYPMISKEVSQIVREARIGVKRGDGTYAYRLKKLNGEILTPNGKKSQFNCEKWKFMLDAPFEVSEQCCNEMKKKPFKKYEKETGKKPYVGTMATESRLRAQAWLRHGCNSFEKSRTCSAPLSFWTEQDILEYVKLHDLSLPTVYGDVVETGEVIQRLDGEHKELTTSKCKRTGCVFCGFGAHIAGQDRYNLLRELEPKLYEYCMRDRELGGLGFGKVIDWMNENGNLGIKK